MRDFLIQTRKGLWMFLMFGLFAFGIFLDLFFIVPFIRLTRKTRGPVMVRMQYANGRLFAGWLHCMGWGGLLKSLPNKGAPMDGPCVVVANHPGLFDAVRLMRDVPGLSVLVKRLLVKQLPLGPIVRSAGYVLAPPAGEGGSIESLQDSIEAIRNGSKFLIFPEGTRSPVHELLPFKAGAFKIAQKAGVPIQPVLIRNEPPFLPKQEHWYDLPLVLSTVELEFWDPIPPPEKDDVRRVAKELERRYREALGLGER